MNAFASPEARSNSSDCDVRLRGPFARGLWPVALATASLVSAAACATGFDASTASSPHEVGGELACPVGGEFEIDRVAAEFSQDAGVAIAPDFPGVVATDDVTRGCPRWTGQVDALMLWQGPIASRPLFVDSATGLTALDANQLQPAMTAAPRYAVLYHRDECRAIEVNYFALWGFNAAQTLPVTSGGYAMTSLAGLDFPGVDTATATASGHIQSFEGNLRRSNGGSIRWLTGFRWVEWGQQLGITDTASGGFFTDALNVGTLNNLYGWQWGADAMLWNNGGPFRVNGIGKAGVYYNHQALQSTTYDDGVNPTVSLADARDTVSFVGEVGLNASLAITNWLAWRAGYTVFWLSGIAVPASQLGVTDVVNGTASINTNGSVLLHGVTTGLEARW